MCSSYAKFALGHLCIVDPVDRDFDDILANLELTLELSQLLAVSFESHHQSSIVLKRHRIMANILLLFLLVVDIMYCRSFFHKFHDQAYRSCQ